MNPVFWLSAGLGVTTVVTIFFTLWVLDDLTWPLRLGLAMLGAGTLFSFWMGLIPQGHLETWPFLLGRGGMILTIECMFGKRVRTRLGEIWIFGPKLVHYTDDEDMAVLTDIFARTIPDYKVITRTGDPK